MMSRVEVIRGIERRRRWSAEEKRAIVAASFEGGACVTDVARRCDVHPNQIYRWHQALSARETGFAEVVVVPDAPGAARTPVPAAMVELEIAGKLRIRLPLATPPTLAAAIVKALGVS